MFVTVEQQHGGQIAINTDDIRLMHPHTDETLTVIECKDGVWGGYGSSLVVRGALPAIVDMLNDWAGS